MAERGLSEELIKAGKHMLAALDEIGLCPQGCGWIFDHELGDWGYYIFSAFVDVLNKRKVYGLVADALDRVNTPKGWTIYDLHILSPRDPLFLVLVRGINVSGNSIVHIENCNFFGTQIDAVLYRMQPQPPEPNFARLAKAFEQKVGNLIRPPPTQFEQVNSD